METKEDQCNYKKQGDGVETVDHLPAKSSRNDL